MIASEARIFNENFQNQILYLKSFFILSVLLHTSPIIPFQTSLFKGNHS